MAAARCLNSSEAAGLQPGETAPGGWRRAFVGAVYADQNRSAAVRGALAKCLARLSADDRALNVGSGRSRIARVVSLDIVPNPFLDVCGRAEELPFADASFALVISQETLEHLRDPWVAVEQIGRVLRPGGTLYLQLPFVIGWHPGPHDFWRFSREGIEALVEGCGLRIEERGLAVGPATGFYRIAVEFGAVLASCLWGRLYHPVKALSAVLLYPLKFLDPLLSASRQADRIAGGYYAIARKPGS